MWKNSRFARRVWKIALGLSLAITHGCETASSEDPNAGKSGGTTVSVNAAMLEEGPEIDGDIYLPYYKEADLPKLELTPLETPADGRVESFPLRRYELRHGCITEFVPVIEEKRGFKSPAQPGDVALEDLPIWFVELDLANRPAAPIPQHIAGTVSPDGSVPSELHGEIAAFLRSSYPALNACEFQMWRIGAKGMYTVVCFSPQSVPDRATPAVVIETERFKVEKGDSQWQIRSPTVTLPEVGEYVSAGAK